VAIQNIGVVGAGQMGAGIAQVAAMTGFLVHVVDVNASALEKGRAMVASSLQRFQKKGELSEQDVAQILERMSWSESLKDLLATQFVIEAVPENESLKKKILSELNIVLAPDVVIASNTSSISIARLGKASGRSERFIGMHFMNPVPRMKLVEIIRSLATSDQTYQMTAELAQKMGKTTTLSKDYPGFVANRILMPMINEAFFALMEGVASPTDIDMTMKLGTNQPMGPLQLADFIGLDTCLAIMEVLHSELGDGKYRPCPLLRQYVDAGWVGKKVLQGVYRYEAENN